MSGAPPSSSTTLLLVFIMMVIFLAVIAIGEETSDSIDDAGSQGFSLHRPLSSSS